MKAELPELLLPDAQAWRRWLEENHASSQGIWLIEHKKGGTTTELTYAQALDEALCFGWIDGQSRSRDDGSYFQRFTPRGPRSIWSVRNRTYVDRLRAGGRMRESGERAVAAAHAVPRRDVLPAGQGAPEAGDGRLVSRGRKACQLGADRPLRLPGSSTPEAGRTG